MARSIKVRIRSEALEERLANLGSRSNAAMRLALQESADMVRDYAKKHHRFKSRSGKLEKSVISSVRMNSDTGKATVRLDRRIARYSNIVHEGAKPHFIFPRRARALYFFWERIGRRVLLDSVYHPGQKADPFLREAAEAVQPNVDDIFRRHLNMLIRGSRSTRSRQLARAKRIASRIGR